MVEPVDPSGGRVFDFLDVGQGLRGLMSSVLYRPLMVTANQQDSLPKPNSSARVNLDS